MRVRIAWCTVIVFATKLAQAQSEREAPAPIQDNSFLIEEAYNQESRVVQHIVTLQHFADPVRFWGFSLTQEVPLHGQRHQLSWTLPYFTDEREDMGLGDVAFHYRYQLLDGSNGVAIAPRVSIFIPTGNEYGHGSGDFYPQINLPISIQTGRSFATHLNAGATHIRDQEAPLYFQTENQDFTSYNLGGSVIWLAHPLFNVLCEIVHNSNETFDGVGGTAYETETILNPGLRAAINTSAGQFVPGLGVPIRFADDETDVGVFFYFSFEHGY